MKVGERYPVDGMVLEITEDMIPIIEQYGIRTPEQLYKHLWKEFEDIMCSVPVRF